MFYRLREKFSRFMYGRYGRDDLSQFLVYVILGCIVLSMFIKSSLWNPLTLLLLIVIYFRMFSKDHQKRYEENLKFLEAKVRFMSWFRREQRLMDQRKDNHIYTCPTCKQKIRIPKGKGKIVVRCPKCQTEFTKRS